MSNTYIKSPINYIGNKYKLLNQIIPLFPENIHTFVDLFGGSGTVLINTTAQNYIYNDINNFVADIFDGLVNTDESIILNQIDVIIKTYDLSKTNKDGFEKLREDYNNGKNDWVYLYILMCYSFNYQCRFNNKHQYNSSFGKDRSSFSQVQRNNIKRLKSKIQSVTVTSKSFKDIDLLSLTENDLVYLDPPYLNSVGNYNDGRRGFEGWTEEHEKSLLSLLDELDSKSIRFALSNNLRYKNKYLDSWKDKYHIHYLNSDYSNCNYQKTDKEKNKDIEVLITNY